MDFKEWYREAKKTNDCGFTAKDFFEAGQQRKQTEIDALKAEIISIINSITSYEYDLDTMGKINKIKELLK